MLRASPRLLTRLWHDMRGMILPYVTMMIIVLIGLSVLALDGARYMSLQTQLQDGADALALAGAAELDRLPDSEVRAVAAINNLLANSATVGGGAAVRVARIAFLSRLPKSDAGPLSEALLATDPMSARFVSVTVVPIQLSTVLPASIFGAPNLFTAGASAVAGFDQVVCDMTPVFVCNPYELPGMSYDEAASALQYAAIDPTVRRRLLLLRRSGGEQYRPGEYGFLDSPAFGDDANAAIDTIARAQSGLCFRYGTLGIRRDVSSSVRDAFNVRFDLYAGTMFGRRNDAGYGPAENVRKGYVGAGAGGVCTAQPAQNWPIGGPPNQATGLPLDRVWPYMNGRMGNGAWDFDTYWQVNHGGAGRSPPVIDNEPVNNANLASRYAIYRYEVEQGLIGDRSPGGENGVPACYGGGTLSAVSDRRILSTAIVNCLSANLEESPSAVTVVAFGKFFLTLPVPSGSNDLYAEMVGLVSPGDHGNFDMVQLYR